MSREPLYLDANGTSPPAPGLWELMAKVAQECYGNPGSAHQIGRIARKKLEESRQIVAQVFQARTSEVIFTSGGTESTNLAILGLAEPVPVERRTILTTNGEHPATRESVQRLIQRGWKRIEIPLIRSGLIDHEFLKSLDWSEVGLVAVLLAHNETGVIQDCSVIREKCAEQRIPWHVDIVQAVGRIPVSFQELGATAASGAVHKCHGPRGVGVLLLKEGYPFTPSLVGGFQEKGRRPGTEAVPLIAGLAETLRDWHDHAAERYAELLALRDRFENLLLESLSEISINGREAPRLPNTSNVMFSGVDGEAMLASLDLEGVCCSLGSACASGSAEPSPVLLAMGIEPELARSAVRFSLHRQLTQADVAEAVQRIVRVATRLRAFAAS
ncbi:MAG: cysteine desulfurase [Planctomycetaceae bacterium]|nr:cysteine desulfurase [Planctomycetaceae bacterium]